MSIQVAERSEEYGDHVGVDRRRMRSVPVLRRVEDELEAVLHERMLRLLRLVPTQHNIAAATNLAGKIRALHAVFLRTIGPQRFVFARHDDVGFVEGRIHGLTMHGKVLACGDELVFFAIELQASALRVPGDRIRHLVVADGLRRRAAVHDRRDPLLGLRLEIAELIALGVGAVVEDPLQVDVGAPFAHELPVIDESLVTGEFRELGTDERLHLDVAHSVEGPLHRGPRERHQEGIRHRRCHVGMLQLEPGIDAKHDVGPLARGAPPPFVDRYHLDARQHVHHGVEVPLHVAQNRVRVGEPHRLGRRRDVRRARQQLVADAQGMILVVVVVRGLGLPILLGTRVLFGIQFDVKRILVDPLRRAVEECGPVVAGVGSDVAADLADIASQRREQHRVAILVVAVEELVRTHADRNERRAGFLGDVTCERLDRRGRRPGDLFRRFRIEVRRVLAHQVERGPAAHLAAVGERHLDRTFEQRILDVRVLAHLVAGEHLGRVGVAVPPDVVAPFHAHLLADDRLLMFDRRRFDLALREHRRIFQLRDLAAKYILRTQVLQRVHADQHRQIGPLIHVLRVVQLLAQDHVRQPQRQCGRRAGTHHDHVVALGRGR